MDIALDALTAVAKTVGLGGAFEALKLGYAVADNVKVQRRRCKHLLNQCALTLTALTEAAENANDSPQLQEAIDEFEGQVRKIYSRMEKWSKMSLPMSIIKRDEINTGLDEFYSDLQFGNNAFQLRGVVDANRENQEQRLRYDKDQAEIKELLYKLTHGQDTLKDALRMNEVPEPQQGMLVNEEILLLDDGSIVKRPSVRAVPTKDVIGRPPVIDLTSEVKKLSDLPAGRRGDIEVYEGQWNRQEKVALRWTRGVNESEASKQKFYYEISIWLNLQHNNVIQLYGIANLDERLYTVCPWSDGGDAAEYVSENPHADRLKLILDFAKGASYIHSQGIVHNYLRAINLFVSRQGVGRLAAFRRSIYISDIEKVRKNAPGAPSVELGSTRWRAPELIDYSEYGQHPAPTPETDVWSFGMVCVEMLTDRQPYDNLGSNENAISKAICNGLVPERSTIPAADDRLWNIMNACWQQRPLDRISMAQVVDELQKPAETFTGGIINDSPLSAPLEIQPEPEVFMNRRFSLVSRHPYQPPLSSPISEYASSPPSRSATATVTKRPHSHQGFPEHRDTLKPLSQGFQIVHGSPVLQPTFPLSPSMSPEAVLPKLPMSSGSSVGSLWSPSRTDTPPHSGSIHSDGSKWSHHSRRENTSGTSQPDLSRKVSSGTSLKAQPPDSDDEDDFADFQISSPPPKKKSLQLVEADPFFVPQPPPVPPKPSPQLSVHQGDPVVGAVLKLSDTDEVLRGNVPALINHLLAPSKSLEPDVEFRPTFLACYSGFLNDDEFFSALRIRYQSVQEAGSSQSVELRNTILNVLRLWLSQHRVFLRHEELLNSMKLFVLGIKPSQDIAHNLSMLQAIVVKKEAEFSRNITLQERRFARGPNSDFKPSNTSPRDFSIALTIWASDLYKDLVPEDVVSWIEDTQGKHFIGCLLILRRKLSTWVRERMLEPQTKEVRAARYNLFIDIAKECQRQKNYLCMTALASGCNDPAITQTSTYKGLSKERLSALKEMAGVAGSPREYHARLGSDALQRRAIIPDIDAHLKEISLLWKKAKRKLVIDGVEMIEFHRYSEVNQEIRKLLDYQKLPYQLEQYREKGALWYMEDTMRKINPI